MTDPIFVHLRLHSEFSVVDGLVRIPDVVQLAKNDQQPALAITDLANLFGALKFYQATRKEGIKPIIGCDLWVSAHNENNPPHRLLLLVKNHQGYLNLCRLLSNAWLKNNQQGQPEVDRNDLNKETTTGLIALSGADYGEVGRALLNQQFDLAKQLATHWVQIFGEHFYIEVQRYGQAREDFLLQYSIALAKELNLPVVATHPIQFLKPEEFTAHEARTCISQGEILANPKRKKVFTEKQHFKSRAEMVALFADYPEVLANTVQIAKRCNFSFELGKPQFPVFTVPSSMSLDSYLQRQTEQGLEQRLQTLYPDQNAREAAHPRYQERLLFEIQTIIQMGFAGYFLIVADFINWAKNNQIPVGPGRGSGAGSLVAYALGITDLDPLQYNLLFERFLNPERVSMPDFDIDFCQQGRDRVIQYVKNRYGADAVSQIATFGTMAAKAAVRDVGRVLDLGYNFCDGIAKLIPFKPGRLVTIADARKEEPLLLEREQNEEEVKQLLALAEQVEGITRNVGMHAGGVLIVPGRLTDFCPLYSQPGTDTAVSQFDKDDVEAIGLIKFDFLGLTTLTILDWAVRFINQTREVSNALDLSRLPLIDKKTYQLLAQAKTVAVFQLESRGMQGMLKDARPDRFEDIIALVALYRPGPMDLIPDFCRRKHGEPFDYPDPRTEKVLSETYGIMVYQEQVMQIAQIIGGYSLGGADLLRRAMGKKKPEEMAKHRDIFRQGAGVQGLNEHKADEIFDLMEKFAGYGFNKSHATAYALLAYQTAYLKTHYPAEFMAANLSLAINDTDKIKILIEDAINICQLKLLPPDIHQSDYHFVPVFGENGQSTQQIRYGLGAIKGTGQAAIEGIIAERKNGPFSSLFNFCERIDRRLVNRRVIEALIKAGAFDQWQVSRGNLLASVTQALEGAEQKAASLLQASLFGAAENASTQRYIEESNWNPREQLIQEKIALGFYFSGHLFDAYRVEVRRFAKTPIAQLTAQREPRIVAGIISQIRTQMTHRGKIYILSLDDASGVIDVVIYREVFDAYRNLLQEDALIMIEGRVSEDRFSNGLRLSADQLISLEAARVRFGHELQIQLSKKTKLAELFEVIHKARSETGIGLRFIYQHPDYSCALVADKNWKVMPSDALQKDLQQQCAVLDAVIVYN